MKLKDIAKRPREAEIYEGKDTDAKVPRQHLKGTRKYRYSSVK